LLATNASALADSVELSLGTTALSPLGGNYWWSFLEFGLLDNSITSSPSGVSNPQITIENTIAAGLTSALFANFHLRMDARQEYAKLREKLEAETLTTDQSKTKQKTSATLVYQRDSGLEFFGGYGMTYIQPTKRTTSTSIGDSTLDFASARLLTSFVGIVRRNANWNAGVYHLFGSEEVVQVRQEAFDGTSLEFEEYENELSSTAAFGEVNRPWGQYEFELSFIEANGKGPRDAENRAMLADHFRARIGGRIAMNTDLSLRTALFHQTLSYDRSSHISLNSIPRCGISMSARWGEQLRRLDAGFRFSYGHDVQSLSSINAQYDVRGYDVFLSLADSF
jgi:hypothetical protein